MTYNGTREQEAWSSVNGCSRHTLRQDRSLGYRTPPPLHPRKPILPAPLLQHPTGSVQLPLIAARTGTRRGAPQPQHAHPSIQGLRRRREPSLRIPPAPLPPANVPALCLLEDIHSGVHHPFRLVPPAPPQEVSSATWLGT